MTKEERIAILKKDWANIRHRFYRVSKLSERELGVPYSIDSYDVLSNLIAKGWNRLTTKELNEVGVRLSTLKGRDTISTKGFKMMIPTMKIALASGLSVGETFRALNAINDYLGNEPIVYKYRLAESVIRKTGGSSKRAVQTLFKNVNKLIESGGDVNAYLRKSKTSKKLLDV